jgi:LysR family hydrogen peroxide-inducible transcriptional activator
VIVGAVPTVGPYLVPQLIERCRALHPLVELDFLEDFASNMTEEIADGSIDFGLFARGAPDARLTAEPLFVEPLLLMVAGTHKLANQPRIVAADLAGERLVLLGERTSLTMQIRRFLGDGAVEPHVTHRCAQVDTVKALVSSGHGIAFLPQIVRDERSDPRRNLVYRTLSESQPRRTISIVRHHARYQSRASLAVQQTLRQIVMVSVPGSQKEAPG